MIAELSTENKQLKAQLKTYDENGFRKLVDETLKMKRRYDDLIKESIAFKEQYEALVLEQKRIMNAYANEIKHIET